VVKEQAINRDGPKTAPSCPEPETKRIDLVQLLQELIRALEPSKADPSIEQSPRIDLWEDTAYRYLEIKLPECPASRGIDLNLFGGVAYLRIER
jgi:hypothetical protein